MCDLILKSLQQSFSTISVKNHIVNQISTSFSLSLSSSMANSGEFPLNGWTHSNVNNFFHLLLILNLFRKRIFEHKTHQHRKKPKIVKIITANQDWHYCLIEKHFHLFQYPDQSFIVFFFFSKRVNAIKSIWNYSPCKYLFFFCQAIIHSRYCIS